MLHRKQSSCFEEKIIQNSKNPKKLWKTLKCLGLNAQAENKGKFYLTKDGTIRFEPRKKANIFRKFYSELVANLVKKYQLHLINLTAILRKITVIFNNKKTSFSYSAPPKMLQNSVMLKSD